MSDQDGLYNVCYTTVFYVDSSIFTYYILKAFTKAVLLSWQPIMLELLEI